MNVQPYDWQPAGTGASTMFGDTDFDAGAAMGPFSAAGGFATGGSNDAISRMLPPWESAGDWDESDASSGLGSSSLMSSLQGIMQQLGGLMQQLTGGSGSQFQPQPEQYFQNASGGSTGDPHLSFDGSTWNNMSSQPNLLDSNSFPGGFQISTQTTSPNPNGVTWNQSATITTNYGQSSVSLNNSGMASIISNGQQVPIGPGQTVQLSNGDSVTQNQNGSLQMTAQNNWGGSITTTLSPNGNGVDVQTTAQNVDLGGALVNDQNGAQNSAGNSQRNPWQPPQPEPTPLPINRPPYIRDQAD